MPEDQTNAPTAPWLQQAQSTPQTAENGATAAASAPGAGVGADTTATPAADPIKSAAFSPAHDKAAGMVEKVEAVVAEAVDTVTVTVPKAFKLMLDHFHVKEFKAGVQEMERAHAEHWYSKANGVVIYTKPADPAE